MSFDPLMWFALSEMDADDEERENENDSYDNHWSDPNWGLTMRKTIEFTPSTNDEGGH